jgi:hypothetical protein
LLLSSFCWSVYICMWRPVRDFVPPFSQGLHFNIVCYPFCYLSIPIGLGSSVLWNIFGDELLSHAGVQSDRMPPVEHSGSTFCMPFSNRSFLADPLSASQNKEFVLSLLIFRVSSSRRRAHESRS